MAALGSQSISQSYEQLLHVDRDGCGNGTTHVSVKDGDNGTTFPITLATDAIMITSTNRLEFGDDASYIHQSADGVLDLVSDTEIEINATTIDINGNSLISGTLGIGVDSAVVALDIHADTVETVAVFGQADDGAAYIATRCGEVQNTPMGYIFQVGSTALAGYSSGTTTATILSTVKNSGGALQGDLNFSTNQGDSLQSRFNIASNGDLTATDTSIGSISDERFKTNIKDYSGGLDTINALRPVTFEHKESTKLREGTQRGFIAQEVEKVDSFWIRKSTATEEDDFYDLVKDDGAEYYISKITEKDTLYVSAIKEMSAQIDALTKRIEALEA